jgi:hypothetical protein
MAWPVMPVDAYKGRVTITDTKDNLFGMKDVAVGVELEFSQFTDRDDVDWMYLRVGIPLMASRRLRGGFWDHSVVRGWPSLTAEQQTEYFRGPTAGPAWLLGFSAKYLRSDTDGDRLAIGPTLAFEWLRAIEGRSAGWGLSVEVDTGLDVRGSDHYVALSLGLTMQWGGPIRW